jgi:hypothetical protein
VSKPSDLVQGTLDLLLLKILALEPLHGWAISQRLTQVSREVLQVSDGSLYPALHKLEQEGWITLSGRRANSDGGRNSTPSPAWAADSWRRSPRIGSGWRTRLPRS